MVAGLAESHVYLIINGFQSGNISRKTVAALAEAGDVRLEWLMLGSGPPGHFGIPYEAKSRRDTEDPPSHVTSTGTKK